MAPRKATPKKGKTARKATRASASGKRKTGPAKTKVKARSAPAKRAPSKKGALKKGAAKKTPAIKSKLLAHPATAAMVARINGCGKAPIQWERLADGTYLECFLKSDCTYGNCVPVDASQVPPEYR